MILVHRVVEPRAPSTRPPVVVLLHGIGADEEDLLPLVEFLDPRFLVVSARAPHEAEPMGHRWYEIDWTATPPRADPDEIVASRELLARFVEEAIAAYSADPARVFLLGFSQGAIMALALLLARPDLVRGVVAHSGREHLRGGAVARGACRGVKSVSGGRRRPAPSPPRASVRGRPSA